MVQRFFMTLFFMRILLFFFIMMIFSVQGAAQATSPFFNIDKTPELGKLASFKASALCDVADETQAYLQQFSEDTFAVHAGKVFDESVTLNKVKKTLAFICQTYREDVRAKRQSRFPSFA